MQLMRLLEIGVLGIPRRRSRPDSDVFSVRSGVNLKHPRCICEGFMCNIHLAFARGWDETLTGRPPPRSFKSRGPLTAGGQPPGASAAPPRPPRPAAARLRPPARGAGGGGAGGVAAAGSGAARGSRELPALAAGAGGSSGGAAGRRVQRALDERPVQPAEAAAALQRQPAARVQALAAVQSPGVPAQSWPAAPGSRPGGFDGLWGGEAASLKPTLGGSTSEVEETAR